MSVDTYPFTKTAQGQTLLELGEEFIKALKDSKTGSEDMDEFFDYMVEQESQPPSPKLLDAISNVAGMGYNAWESPILQGTDIKISPVLLHWIAAQSKAIPDFITTMIGLYAIVFYHTHPKGETMTLRWVGEQVGKGKLINHRQFFPWFAVSKDKHENLLWNSVCKNELYSYENTAFNK